MSIPAVGDPGNPPTEQIRDAAFNAVAVAALAYQRELTALRVILQAAHGHGLKELEIVQASGLPASLVSRLLAEVA